MKSIKNLFLPSLLLCFLFGVSGCGGGGETKVYGTIQWDGAPVATGKIDFEPADGRGKAVSAEIIEGQYEVRVSPGDKIIRLFAFKVAGKRKMYETPDSPMMDVYEQIIPAKFNTKTELKLTVTGSSQEYNYPQ